MGDKVAGREAKVLFEYQKDEVDELTLEVGDIIKNVTPVPNVDGWCEGDLNGLRGMFPSNFVEFLPSSNDSDGTHSTADAGSADIAGRKAIARFDYEATAEDELTLQVNDIVDVISVVEPGWWQGMLKGKTGVFPDNFCELLPEEKPNTKLATTQNLADRPPAPLPAQQAAPPAHEEPRTPPAHTNESDTKPEEEDSVDATLDHQTEDDKRKSRFGGVGFGNIISQDLISGAKLRKVDKKVPAPPASAPAAQEKIPLRHVAPSQTKEEDKDDKRKRKAPPVPPGGKKPTEKVRVQHDYAPQNEDELKLSRGDIVVVLNKDVFNTQGWWEGELNGKVGLFPENFVERIPSDQEEKKKEPPPLPTGPKKTSGAPLLPSQASADNKQPQTAPVKSSTESPPLPVKEMESKKPLIPTSTKPSIAGKPALPNKKPVPPKPEGKKPEFPKKKLPGPPEPLKKQLPVPPLKEEKLTNHVAEKPGEVNLDEVGPTETLTHLTANRAKAPIKAPPSRFSRTSWEGRLSGDLEKEDEKKAFAVIEPVSDTKEPAWKKEIREAKEAPKGNHLQLKSKKSSEGKIKTPAEEKTEKPEIINKEPEEPSARAPTGLEDEMNKMKLEMCELREQMQAMEKRHKESEKKLRLDMEMLISDIDEERKNVAALKIEIDRIKRRDSLHQNSVER